MLTHSYYNKEKKNLKNSCKLKDLEDPESFPPVVISGVMEHMHFCIILGRDREREIEGTGTRRGTEELFFQRGLLQSRTLDSFHRDAAQRIKPGMRH